MKVLQVAPYFYPAWAYGGIPRLSYHLANSLAQLGVEVEVVTTDALDQNHRRGELNFVIDGVKVRGYKNLSNYLAYHFQFFLPMGLTKEKSGLKGYDLVHIHGHRNLLNSRLSLWANQAKVPVILQPNGTLANIERRQSLKAIYDLLIGNRQIKKTALFIAVSEAEKKQFIGTGIPEEKIRIVPNGVFVEESKPGLSFKEKFGIKDDYILYLGKLTPRKGIEYIIQALSLIPDKNLKAVVAGNDMGMLPQLKSLVKQLNLHKRVIFTGLLLSPWKELAYKDALVTVYAGQDEIFGLVQFESILCGTPAIVADDSGAGEWLKKSGGGYIVPYGDARAIAEVIMNLKTEKDEIKEAQKWIEENLSWEKIAKDMKGIYQELVGKR